MAITNNEAVHAFVKIGIASTIASELGFQLDEETSNAVEDAERYREKLREDVCTSFSDEEIAEMDIALNVKANAFVLDILKDILPKEER